MSHIVRLRFLSNGELLGKKYAYSGKVPTKGDIIELDCIREFIGGRGIVKPRLFLVMRRKWYFTLKDDKSKYKVSVDIFLKEKL